MEIRGYYLQSLKRLKG